MMFACWRVYTADVVTSEDCDFLRLKNELVTAFQTQLSLRPAFYFTLLSSAVIQDFIGRGGGKFYPSPFILFLLSISFSLPSCLSPFSYLSFSLPFWGNWD